MPEPSHDVVVGLPAVESGNAEGSVAIGCGEARLFILTPGLWWQLTGQMGGTEPAMRWLNSQVALYQRPVGIEWASDGATLRITYVFPPTWSGPKCNDYLDPFTPLLEAHYGPFVRKETRVPTPPDLGRSFN